MTTDEAISELGYMLDYHLRTNGHHNVTKADEALTMAIEALKGEQWIPVSKRMPEEFGWYCITHKDWDNSDVAFWEKRWLNGQGTVVKDVIAWMPIPEPYKEQQNEN